MLNTIGDKCTTKGEVFPGCDKTDVKWYRLADEKVYAKTQTNLSAKYASGMGALKDHVYAYMLGNIAATTGSNLCAKLRHDLETKVTPAEIPTAQNPAREGLPKEYKGC